MRNLRRRLDWFDWFRLLMSIVVAVCWWIALIKVEDTATFVAILLTGVMANWSQSSHEHWHHGR